ncbi:hypothetical protein [Saccharothrix sp. ALI-22-I]|uniref:hypothetical protein n=1 Tax=Saccharothrix sp. ALI-22-I TaxID=1933778 RepID=UPI0015C38C5A|nr:hypothetical protein [Saccharothrix sp. ALI-22-I]
MKRKIFELTYEHFRAHEGPMLWAGDAIAWSYGAGGEWRRRVAGRLEKVHRLEVP